MQDERVSRIIKYLKDIYTFDYVFSTKELKKYGFKNWKIKSEWTQNPIYFSPNEKEKCLTVMAFGGCIAWIPLDAKKEYFTSSEKGKIKAFARYLSDKKLFYKDGYNHIFYLPDSFVEKYSKDRFQKVKDLIKGRENTIEELLTNVEFVDMLVCAAYVRYMHRPKGIMEDVSERSMETMVASQAWQKYEQNNMLVIDIEYKPELSNKVPAIDFLLLDKDSKSFGLVEFKYQGMSMDEKSSNDLSVHFDDFIKIILDKEVKRKVLSNIIDKLSLLLESGIFVELRDLMNEIKEKIQNDDIENSLWCGFYFLDEKRMISSRKELDGNVPLIERIEYDCKRQIISNQIFADVIKNREIDVRYQHSYLEEDIQIRMNENLIDKFSE